MSGPTKHARLSASSSERWLHCTAAPRFEEQFPDGDTSVFAQEGTLAHAVCELFCRRQFKGMPKQVFESSLEALKQDPMFNSEMIRTAEFYRDYVMHVMLTHAETPFVAFETRVDLQEFVPEGFGTCDCIIIGGDTLHIIDYKHGRGVPVSAIGNTQMRLYALGALSMFRPIYGGDITWVTMDIVQPRLSEEINRDAITVADLEEWGHSIKPTALSAYTGEGAEFVPGEWCRFCKGRALCRARSNVNTAFEEFKDVANAALTDDEVADLLTRAQGLVAWYNDLQTYAEQAILSGHSLPGWKVVAGRSARAFTDTDAAMDAMRRAGFDDAMLYDRKPKTLAALEKMCGKKMFREICGDLITTPMGKPTLVGAEDPRADFNSAVADFSGAQS